MVSVSRALGRIKSDLEPYLPGESVEAACRGAGHRWRERLGPVATLHLFVLQVLHFNTAIRHLRHLAGRPVNAAAYCKARMRLPLGALQRRCGPLRGRCAGRGGGRRGCPRPVVRAEAFLVDGTGTITPDTPALRAEFGQPRSQKPGCGFPVPKLLALFDAFSGMVVELLASPLYTQDLRDAWRLHPLLGPGRPRRRPRVLLVRPLGAAAPAGRGGVLPHAPAGDRRLPARPPPRGRGRPRAGSCGGWAAGISSWSGSGRSAPAWMTAEQFDSLPPTLPVREVRPAGREGNADARVTVATTLLDPKLYPKDKVAELYGLRWRAETLRGTEDDAEDAQAQEPDGRRGEERAGGVLPGLQPGPRGHGEGGGATGHHPDRVGFLDALRWLLTAEPGEPVPDLVVNPRRAGRHEPRDQGPAGHLPKDGPPQGTDEKAAPQVGRAA